MKPLALVTPMASRPLRGLALAVALATCTHTSADAQASERGSRYVESGHWAYEYLARLRNRGYLTQLDPMVRPYHQVEIVQGLASLDPDTLPAPVSGWVRLLRSTFQREHQQWGAVVMAGTRAANTERFDPLRPIGDGEVWPNGSAGVWVEGGHVAAESRVAGDFYLNHDPELRAPHRARGGLPEHTYLSISVQYAGLDLGRIARNWGPAGTRGLLLSDAPLAYPQLGFEGRFGPFRLQAFTAELDTLAGAKRYLAAQRVAYTSGRFAIALADAILYTGPNLSPSLALLNPLAPLVFEHENPPADDRNHNFMASAHAWYRFPHVVLQGEFLIDDIALDEPAGADRPPTRYAFTAGARVLDLAPWLELAAEYRQVSSFAYRSYPAGNRYDYLGRGLGESFSDHDVLSITADLFPPLPGLTLTPAFQMLRQGEGDFRDSMPNPTVFRASPNLLMGAAERSYRIGLRGRYQPNQHLWLTWDLGHNQVRDADHVVGRSRSEFVALGELGLRFEFGTRRQ